MTRILLTHSPEAPANYYGARALAGAAVDVGHDPDQKPTPRLAARPDVIATPHVGGLTPQAVEHQSLETVARAAEILKGRVPRGTVEFEH